MSEIDLQAQPAVIGGEARRISKEEKDALALKARPAILKATIHITRAATGAVETYEITGTEADPSNTP